MKIITFIFLFLGFISSSSAQKAHIVRLLPEKELLAYFPSSSIAFVSKDTIETSRRVSAVIAHLHAKGLLTAAVDSVVLQHDTLKISLFLGPSLKRAVINTKNISVLVLRKTGLKTSFNNINKFSYKEFSKMEFKLVDYYQTVGYPFATVFLDSISLENRTVVGTLKLEKGPFIVFDSIQIEGKTKTKKKFLYHFTRIRVNDPFDQTLVDNAYKLLKQLPYLRVNGYPKVSFVNGKASVIFPIDDRKANQVDGVAGFAPNQQTNSTQPTKIIVTGEFNLNLKNMAGRGKNLKIEWRRLKPESQQLDLEYFHPNLFGSPINVIPVFGLLKQDTTFQTVTSTLKTNFNLGANVSMGFYVGSKQSRLLSTKRYATYLKPPFLDYNLNTYGVDYEWNNLDDYFYPKRGNRFFVDANVGVKSIKSNSRLPERLYDNVRKSNTQFYFKSELSHYFKTGKRSTLLANVRTGRVFNDNLLVTNDLFLIGGLKTMRGFNENFFYAEYYSTGTLEFRQFTDERSYVMVFAEQSFMKYRLGPDSVDDWPIGMGLGLSLSTNTGIFNFVYSLGQAQTQKLQFNQAKVHFGYITRF